MLKLRKGKGGFRVFGRKGVSGILCRVFRNLTRQYDSSVYTFIILQTFRSIADIKNTAQFDELGFGVLTYTLGELSQ